ncbi:MAG: isopentenyl phosphate kinase family protein [Candidatus Odinarchaeota archaeon]|nr:isopentenyl phosphate kinase family protein [Candidatus Odinarchaeota archaeon]
MKKENIVLIKFGGSILSDKSKPFSLRVEVLKRLIEELTYFHGKMIIIHGGGSFGHPVANAFNYKSNRRFIDPQGIAHIHYAMRVFNNIIVKLLLNKGLNAISFEPMSYLCLENSKIKNAFLEGIRLSLKLGLIPVTFGDIALDEELGSAIISGDTLLKLLAIEMKVNKLVVCTDVDGVFIKENGNKKLVREINSSNIKSILELLKNEKQVTDNNKIDVTGGMYYKITELWEVAKKGIPVIIINGLVPNRLKNILLKKSNETQTIIKP